MDLMTGQRAELELEVNKIIAMDKQATLDQMVILSQKSIVEYEEKLQSSLRDLSTKFQKTLEDRVSKNTEEQMAEFKDECNFFVAKMRQAQVEELLSFQQDIELINGSLKAFDKSAQLSLEVAESNRGHHNESAALLILESILLTNEPLAQYLGGLRDAIKSDPLIVALIDSIPEGAREKGTLTDMDLR